MRCEQGCACKRHTASGNWDRPTSRPCEPGCTCGRHRLREAHPGWKGDNAGYGAVHRRLAVELGPAKARSCHDCGKTAAQWSYNGPRDGGLPYSTDLSLYVARCFSCHRKFDPHGPKR